MTGRPIYVYYSRRDSRILQIVLSAFQVGPADVKDIDVIGSSFRRVPLAAIASNNPVETLAKFCPDTQENFKCWSHLPSLDF